jgi:hypothetical protein
MAFVRLFPPGGGDALPAAEVIRRLRDEVGVVDADPGAGRDHVAGVVVATLRFSDSIPGKRERLAWLRSVRHAAVYVSFGDDLGPVAGRCVMPASELFFGGPDEVNGAAAGRAGGLGPRVLAVQRVGGIRSTHPPPLTQLRHRLPAR